jgi:hypothetical protein
MPQILQTIEEFATQRDQPTIWIVFNTKYNDVHAFHKKFSSDDFEFYLNEKYTDKEARDEFLEYMKMHFPDITLHEVFDLVSVGYLVFPYLGSIAIDCDVGSDVYKSLSKKYGDPYSDATNNNKVLWVIEPDFAKEHHKKRTETVEELS